MRLATDITAPVQADEPAGADAGMPPDDIPTEPEADQGQQTALICLVAVASQFGIGTSVEKLVLEHGLSPAEVGSQHLVHLAQKLGLRARSEQLSLERLLSLESGFPAIAHLDNGNNVVVAGIRQDRGESRVAVYDPLASQGGLLFLEPARFAERWTGELVFVQRDYRLSDPNQPFSLRWFVPELMRQGRAFRDIAIGTFSLYLVALAVPIFFQLVIDKVVAHESASTLYVLTVGVLLALLFEATFGFIRQYLLLSASNKIDVRLATRTFSHLLGLPINYFEGCSAGVVVRHMQQVEKIRQFLTGRLFLTFLDACALFVVIPVLLLYSAKLTVIVLVFAAVIAAIVAAMVGPFRRRLLELYNAEAEKQAMLVETIHGMRTVKTLAIEPIQRRKWDERTAATIRTHFRVGKIGISAQAATGFLEKAMIVAIIAFGAQTVFDHQMTIGALIAFQMLSGRVVTPLVQIVSLVQEYQEAALSVRMLATVMNHPVEQRRSSGLTPGFTGAMEFDRVSFRYAAGGTPVLDRVSLRIPAGTVVGVVGKSGSGKTTLTRLMQGLYPVQEGVIRFDGRRYPRDRSCAPATQYRRCAARQLPLQGNDSREHRGHEALGVDAGGHDGRPGLGRARVHRASATGVGHADRRERREPLGRSEAASCNCARPAHPTPLPGSRRSHECTGPRERGDLSHAARQDPRRADGADHFAPAHDAGEMRQHCRPGRRPHRGRGDPPRGASAMSHLQASLDATDSAPLARPRTCVDDSLNAADGGGFLSEAEVIEKQPLPRLARATLYVLAALLGAAALWATFAKVDRIVVGRGKLITTTPTIVVQPLEPSMIRSIDVQVGQIVKKGTRLASFDPTFASSDLSQLSARHASLDAQVKRLERELAREGVRAPNPTNAEELLQSRIFQERRSHLESRLLSLDENVERLKAAIEGNKREQAVLRERLQKTIEIERMYESLGERNYVPKLKILETQRDRLQIERDLEQSLNMSAQLEREMGKFQADRTAFSKDWRQRVLEELVVVRRDRDAVADQLKKAERKTELTVVTAPADGVVQEIAKRSTGSVLKEAEPLLTLVPLDAPLEAEVQIDARYISYIRPGDPARIKVDAFPFQQYGVIKGRVRTVSEDAFVRSQASNEDPTAGREAFYLARVTLEDNSLQGVPADFRFLPGMTLSAEVVFGDRTVMSYLLYPIIRSLDEGLRSP